MAHIITIGGVMLKLYRNFLMAGVLSLGLAACGDDLTIEEPPQPPETPNITTFTVSPTSAAVAPGTFVQASATLITKPGVTGSVAWTSSNPAVATVDGSGRIDALTEGTTVVTATATAGTQTATASIGVTVRPIQAAQISIQSITTANLGTPVNIGNVMGQIEINLNFDPGEEIVDSVAVFIGGKRAAMQSYATSPSAGPISLSVNTANYVKNVAAGTTTVDFQNGATTISAAVYPRGASATATNSIQIVLNNADGWAGDMIKPTQVADNGAGVSYWGGPGEGGLTELTVYPVIYTPGRSVTSVTFRPGRVGFVGCDNVTLTALPFRASFGYGDDGADQDCSGDTGSAYEWVGGAFTPRDNIVVVAALDNASTPFAAPAPLIANTVVLGSTPDSARFDWQAPAVNTPSITRSAPAVTGWVNASVSFTGFASSDAGVGIRPTASRDRMAFYIVSDADGDDVLNCVGATDGEIVGGTGAGINGGVACPSNFIGGATGIANGTAPWQAFGTESDRLGNVGTSNLTSAFGTDYTAPAIRWGIASAAPVLVDAVPADTIFFLAGVKPAGVGVDEWRVEYIDERSGFYANGQPSGGTAAQRHRVSTAGHVNNMGLCLGSGAAAIGAAFVTAPTCAMTAITTGGPLRPDGWQAGMSVAVPEDEGYYGYRTDVADAAGNRSNILFRKALVNVESPFSTGLAVPAEINETTMNFIATLADSAEVVAFSMRLDYPNLPTATQALYGIVQVGITFDDFITSPYSGTAFPATGAPYAKRIEIVTGDTWDGVTSPVATNIAAAGVPANVKPTDARVWSWNTGSLIAGGAAPGASALINIPGILVEDGDDIADWNAANPTIAVNYWRVIPTVAETNQFNSSEHLRAQAIAPTNAPNPPFARVDFYRLSGGGTEWFYLGSDASAVSADQGTFRSWVWSMTGGSFVPRWDGVEQTAVVAGDIVIAVGVTASGEGLTTVATTMVP